MKVNVLCFYESPSKFILFTVLQCENRFDNDLEDVELFVTRYKPERLDALCKTTKFTRKEIRLMYQGFKQECPTGVVTEENFKDIFAQFFPQGDSTQYAHYVFKSFKQSHGGTINFEQFLHILSLLSRGSVVDKLQWIFGLYDINGDGYITKQEMLNIVSAIYDMLGHYTDPAVTEHSAREHVERIFHQIDSNKDGVVTMDEFMEWCQKDELRTKVYLC
ncbi:kv channel-interacting protein 4 [Caerostris extrusa]|uniref:Kv channel-interacting protein 4 n=1 Tax=Caerostris extrusa TaxID=172846 RepID=A0AAV4PWV1_CAEEX|nr:kv channel-interacting protein 4 [Caerostris extrusa]